MSEPTVVMPPEFAGGLVTLLAAALAIVVYDVVMLMAGKKYLVQVDDYGNENHYNPFRSNSDMKTTYSYESKNIRHTAAMIASYLTMLAALIAAIVACIALVVAAITMLGEVVFAVHELLV